MKLTGMTMNNNTTLKTMGKKKINLSKFGKQLFQVDTDTKAVRLKTGKTT